MRRLVPLLTTVVACALGASSASAQTCIGLPSFEGRPVRINAAAEFPEAAKAYAIGLGVGRANGPFVSVGAGQVSFDDFEEKATLGFAEAGWQIPLGPAQLCPLAGGSYAKGPNDDLTGLEASSWSAVGGVALGYPLGMAGPAQLIPNVAFRLEHVSQTVEEPGFEPVTGTFDSSLVDLGLALVLSNRLSVQPLLHVLLNPEDDEERTSFGVFVSLGLP